MARSTDGGQTYPSVSNFSASGGSDHFNDKPMIAADTGYRSPYKDNLYVAWDAASGGSSSGGVRFARSSDHGATFTVSRIDNRRGPGRAIAAQPFVGPGGEVYVAWNDYAANTIALNRSFDDGVTFGTVGVIAAKTIPFDIGIPAISFRRALVDPSCDADRSLGPHRDRLYCSWMDLTGSGNTGIFAAYSDDRGGTWSTPSPVTDRIPGVDRFYQWLSVDPTNGRVNISFYDTRNDTTGQRYMTDVYFTDSPDGVTWVAPNVRVSTVSSNEHDWNGVVPCSAIDYGNQYGDYSGLVSFGGMSHPVWTDSRHNQSAADDKALTEEQLDEQHEKLVEEVYRRSHETESQRRHRSNRYWKERNQTGILLGEYLKAFDFTVVGGEVLNGHSTCVLDAKPRVDYRPPNREAKILMGMQGRLWIETEGFHWVKAEAQALKPLSILGIAVRILPGTQMELLMAPISSSVWLVSSFSVSVKASIIWMSTERSEVTSWADYQPASAALEHELGRASSSSGRGR